MAITTVARATGWLDKLNANMQKYGSEISAWSTTGITYKNGFSTHSDGTGFELKYRTIDVGANRTIQISGYINNPALTGSAPQTVFCNIPVSLFKGYTGFVRREGRFTAFWGDQWVGLACDQNTGDLSFTNESSRGDKAITANSIEIDLAISW